MRIRIEDTGEVMAMYHESFDLSSLGDRDIQRVTEILFDPSTQMFYIEHCRTEEHLGSCFDTYSQAVAFEHEWFDATVAKGLDPRTQT